MMFSTPLIIAVIALVLALLALTAVIVTSRKQAELIERQQQRLMMLTETAADVLALKHQLEQQLEQQPSHVDYAQTEQLQQSLELSLKQQLDAQSEQLQQTVAQLQQEQQLLEQKLQQLAEQDPGAKLYQRAAKLIADGATVEDIMQECDLPRAEAELLVAMRK